MRLLDYTGKLLGISETIHRWHATIGALEAERREKVARYAERIAAMLARAAVAFARLQQEPTNTRPERVAVRDLGRISGHVEDIIGRAITVLTGASLLALKGTSTGWQRRNRCGPQSATRIRSGSGTCWRRRATSGRSPPACEPDEG